MGAALHPVLFALTHFAREGTMRTIAGLVIALVIFASGGVVVARAQTVTIDDPPPQPVAGVIKVTGKWDQCTPYKLYLNGNLDANAQFTVIGGTTKTFSVLSSKQKAGKYEVQVMAIDDNKKDVPSNKVTVTVPGCGGGGGCYLRPGYPSVPDERSWRTYWTCSIGLASEAETSQILLARRDNPC